MRTRAIAALAAVFFASSHRALMQPLSLLLALIAVLGLGCSFASISTVHSTDGKTSTLLDCSGGGPRRCHRLAGEACNDAGYTLLDRDQRTGSTGFLSNLLLVGHRRYTTLELAHEWASRSIQSSSTAQNDALRSVDDRRLCVDVGERGSRYRGSG